MAVMAPWSPPLIPSIEPAREKEMDSIGIRNVMRRLELKFAVPCLTIRPGSENGTVCTIRIPL
ncbi:MAG: hypothetical protein B6241_15140 [Spirochaetaceae bacterium 4572_59]|nr:MAG: hypothetical protein B6241_15140 [Spirochaetaceae bacterium 4572_59]